MTPDRSHWLDDSAVRGIAMPILSRALGRFGFREIELREDEFPDGDPILVVTAKYAEDASEPDPRISSAANVELFRQVFEAGDPRTVILMHSLPGDAESLPDW